MANNLKRPVRIFAPDFTFLGEIDDYEEFIFTKRLTVWGEFEMRITGSSPNAGLLSHGRFIYLDNRRAGIIEHIESYSNEKGGGREFIEVKGFTPEYLLSYRIALPTLGRDKWTMSGNGESVIKALVDYNLGTAADVNRKIPVIAIQSNKNRGAAITFESEKKTLDLEVERIAKVTDLGFEMLFDLEGKRFLFDVLKGKDRTVGQNLCPPVIFAAEYDNILDKRLTESTIGHKNVAIIESWTSTDIKNTIVVNGNLSGLNRRELYIDGGTAETNELAKQTELANERLSAHKRVFTLEGTINPFSNLKYGLDYGLGDIITVKYGHITINTTISEVTEKWTAKNGYSIECVFGSSIPTLIDRIKSSLFS